MTNEQKAKKRIEELEHYIYALVREWDWHKSGIETIKAVIKDYQKEIRLLKKKFKLIKNLDESLKKHYKKERK